MAGIPKVRVQFDADFDQLKKGVKGATNEVQSFGSKVGDFSKKAGPLSLLPPSPLPLSLLNLEKTQ
jgi:hypothetical protein